MTDGRRRQRVPKASPQRAVIAMLAGKPMLAGKWTSAAGLDLGIGIPLNHLNNPRDLVFCTA